MRAPKSLAPALLFACLLILGVAELGLADLGRGLDLRRPTTYVVGPPLGFAVSDRLDPSRRGQAGDRLPSAPATLWQEELAGGIDVPPVVDARGAVVLALASPEAVKLSAEGAQLWRVRLGSAPAVAAPVLASDGSVVLVCGDGTLRRLSPTGRLVGVAPLRMATGKLAATPLALDDGSVVVAGRSGMVHLNADGSERARASLPGAPQGGLLWHGDRVLAVTRDGEVFEWRAPAHPKKVGDFGGSIQEGAILASDRTLAAVVDRARVVALDRISGTTSLLLSEADALGAFEGPPTLDRSGVLLVTTLAGELYGIDGHGVVVRRSAIENLPVLFGSDAGAPPGGGGVFGASLDRASPPLVVDPAGLIGFVRSSGKVGVMDAEGRVVVAEARACARPLAALPAGPGRMLVACKSGLLAMYGKK